MLEIFMTNFTNEFNIPMKKVQVDETDMALHSLLCNIYFEDEYEISLSFNIALLPTSVANLIIFLNDYFSSINICECFAIKNGKILTGKNLDDPMREVINFVFEDISHIDLENSLNYN